MRSTDDPLLVLSEVATIVKAQGRCALCNMGDFWRAFPSTWREDIVLLSAQGPRLQGGALHLLGSILLFDVAFVFLSGESVLLIEQGLPEGGVLGPILYLLLPNSLAVELKGARCGLGVNPVIPEAWQNVQWSGHGSPCNRLVETITAAIQNGEVLPTAGALAADTTLLASAARALDLLSPVVLCNLFHADDPIFLASSHGEMQRVLNLAAAWSWKHGAQFHSNSGKNVVFILGTSAGSLPPLSLEVSPGVSVWLQYATHAHRWLGWLWDEFHGYDATFKARCGAASTHAAVLAGLVAARAIPLPLAVVLWESKVMGCMTPGLWLYSVCAANADEQLNHYVGTWLLALVGAPPWTSDVAVRWDLGMPLSGAVRALRCVALRRAGLWCLPEDDLYRSFFLLSHDFPETWSSLSLSKLRHWNIPDFPESGLSLRKYKRMVSDLLSDACVGNAVNKLQKRRAAVSFDVAYPFKKLPLTLYMAARCPLDWKALHGVRSLCRLRLGLLQLTHIGGRQSSAKVRLCIACTRPTTCPVAHVLLVCQALSKVREALTYTDAWGPADEGRLSRLLCLEPSAAGFCELVHLARSIDDLAVEFWKNRPGSLRFLHK